MNEIIDVSNRILKNDVFRSIMEWITGDFFELLFDLIIPCLFIFVLIPIWYHNSCVWFARRRVVKNPTEENAFKVYKALSKFGVSIANHPDEWNKFRNMFYIINGSNKVPTKLKQDIKAVLQKRKLHLNTRIIDNYGKTEKSGSEVK